MSRQAVTSAGPPRMRRGAEPLRVAFVGNPAWLDGCCPAEPAHGLVPERLAVQGPEAAERALAGARAFRPHVTVVFDPVAAPEGLLDELAALEGHAVGLDGHAVSLDGHSPGLDGHSPGLDGRASLTLGVLVGDAPAHAAGQALDGLDRLVSFRPALTGARVGRGRIWRAIPPPVADPLFGEVRPLHGRPRAMAVGRSTAHRERMLMPVKHHHDLLQVIHGVSGAPLAELLGEYDVGVYVAPEPGGGFGQQVGMHLAAGHLLLAETLMPTHGLERNIDYLHVDSPEGLVWLLDRLGRFPEMHQRIRVRGRLKAEQYRASRVFARIAHDLIADVAAFGSDRAQRP